MVSSPGRARSAAVVVIALVAIAACAFALRSVGLEHVFPAPGVVVFENGDGPYHARLAHYAFSSFPRALTFDSYLAGPLGGAVPWPPGFDLVIAAAARMTGAVAIDRVLAWSGPVLGTLAVFAVYAAARTLATAPLALVASMLYAGFGVTVAYSIVGGGDHHCWVGLLGAVWLALALWFSSPRASGWLAGLALGLAAVRALLLLSWSGSLLYVAIADGSLLLVCAATGDERRLRLLGIGALVSAALVAPVVWSFGEISGGAFSTIMLSNLHLTIVASLGVLALAASVDARIRPDASSPRRLAALVVAGIAIVAVLVSIGPIREQLLPALRFMTLNDAAGAGTVEQLPLFPLFGRKPLFPATVYYGAWVYALPVAPVFPLFAARDRSRSVPALVLALWTTPFTVLAVTQVRYGNDVGAAAAVCFALGLGAIVGRLRPRIGEAGAYAAVFGLAIALIVPSVRDLLSNVAPTIEFLRIGGARGDTMIADSRGTLAKFAQQVRAVTPETAGFDGAGQPEYGIVSDPNIGHSLRWYARRPVAADNFWDKFPTWDLASGLLLLTSEDEAVEHARALRARYVVTMPSQMPAGSLGQRLHTGDGRAGEGRPRLERLRLVTEGPRGGVPLLKPYGMRVAPGVQPYKLFEIVAGAVLVARVTPGTKVEAEVAVDTPTGRRFPYRAQAVADANGVARLRVPYASETTAPVHPSGPWRVRVGDGPERSVTVTDADVESGAIVSVPGGEYDGRGAAARP